MGQLDDNSVRQALLAAKIQSFSSELVELQSCNNDDALYNLLIRAAENEPFLMSRLVRVANSAAFCGSRGGYAVGATESLMRIGLSMGKQIAEDFLIDQALGRIARANRFSRSVWREARLAGNVAHLFERYCEYPFNVGGPSLPAIMSYLGELLIMGLVKAEYEAPALEIPTAPGSGRLDVMEPSLMMLAQLQLPEPVEGVLQALTALGSLEGSGYARSAAALLVCRAVVKAQQTGHSFSATVRDEVVVVARSTLGLDDEAFTRITQEAGKISLGY